MSKVVNNIQQLTIRDRNHCRYCRQYYSMALCVLLFEIFVESFLVCICVQGKAAQIFQSTKVKDSGYSVILVLYYLLQEYGINCSDITIERIWSHLDVFAWGHFLGWMFKAVLVRHFGILWAISVMWEFTEVSYLFLLSIEF